MPGLAALEFPAETVAWSAAVAELIAPVNRAPSASEQRSGKQSHKKNDNATHPYFLPRRN
ncbi:MAG: hypothetical protein QG596_1147 [Actinomycetota bacterium]|jgi:hypothetical protein|nr:hypothetical protein [Actinomycetota bacterium]